MTHPSTPPPAALAEAASPFGLSMSGDVAWTKIDRNKTRFDWSSRTSEREILWSFWIEKLDATESQLLVQLVSSAAANLAAEPSGPSPRTFEQPKEFAQVLGVDRVVTACFEASEVYGKGLHQGVMHGIVKNGALSIVVVLSNDRRGIVPLASVIGARGNN